jgi:hypothetical protein
MTFRLGTMTRLAPYLGSGPDNNQQAYRDNARKVSGEEADAALDPPDEDLDQAGQDNR